jgi:uncharacterized protein
MKIWFMRTPSLRPRAADCGDCARTTDEPDALSFPLSGEGMQRLHAAVLKQAESLYVQGGLDEKWLVSDPVGAGRVAVLDAQAFLLLQRFREARTPLEVMRQAPEWSPVSIEEGVGLLYNLGFLRGIHDPAPERRSDNSQTLTAWVHVTNSCNLRCTYCYLSKTQEHMADDIAQQSIDAIFRSARKQRFRRVLLKYAGGEASLRLPHVLEMHDYAMEQAVQTGIELDAHILSNGVVLTQRAIEQLKQRRIGITISLDGVGEAHDRQRPFLSGLGSFRYVDRTITRLLQNALIPAITVTVSQRNLDDLPALISYILERDLPFTLSYYRDNECSTHIQDLQFGEEQMIAGMRRVFAFIEQNLPRHCLLDSLIDKADLTRSHKHTCGVGVSSLVIDQHGGVAKCQAALGQRVTTVRHPDPLQAVQDDRQGIQGVPVDAKEGCSACKWRYWCAGGCPLLTYRFTGRYDLRSPNCHIYQALFPEALRLEALRLLKYERPLVLGSSAVCV